MAATSGLITVTTAGTAVTVADSVGRYQKVAVKAHPDNSDTVWVGNDGADDVSNANGFPLDPGEGIVLDGGLSNWWFDADVNGEKICWVAIEA